MLSVRNTCLSVPERCCRRVNRMIELLSPCISQRLHCLLACVDEHSSIGNKHSCMELLTQGLENITVIFFYTASL